MATLAMHRLRMTRVVEYLRTHLDSPPAHAALARMMGVSPRQFDRVFARLLGETPRAFLRRLKLERAARDLATTGGPILEIALDAGFECHESFTRGFARHFGQSPSAYRALAQVRLLPADRRKFWSVVLAGGLRRHLEGAGVQGICAAANDQTI